MKLPTFNRCYARWRSLRQLVDIAVDKYEYASDELIDVHFGGNPEDFSEYLATNPNGVVTPTQEHMRELIDLIAGTSLNNFVLGYEDRDFLARVRSHLCDALVACMEGDIEHGGHGHRPGVPAARLHHLRAQAHRQTGLPQSLCCRATEVREAHGSNFKLAQAFTRGVGVSMNEDFPFLREGPARHSLPHRPSRSTTDAVRAVD